MEQSVDDSSSAKDLESRIGELKVLNTSIESLRKKIQGGFPQGCKSRSNNDWIVGMEKEGEELTARVQELRSDLEKIQGQQVEDGRTMSKQQKTTERYIAKRQMLTTRKDECNRNIRDLGVLPEEAFEKYINEKLEKVSAVTYSQALV